MDTYSCEWQNTLIEKEALFDSQLKAMISKWSRIIIPSDSNTEGNTLSIEYILPPIKKEYPLDEKAKIKWNIELITTQSIEPAISWAMLFLNNHLSSKQYRDNFIQLMNNNIADSFPEKFDYYMENPSIVESIVDDEIKLQKDYLNKTIKIILYSLEGSKTVAFVDRQNKGDEKNFKLFVNITKATNSLDYETLLVHEIDHLIITRFHSEITKRMLSSWYIQSSCDNGIDSYTKSYHEVRARMLQFKHILSKKNISYDNITSLKIFITALVNKYPKIDKWERSFLIKLIKEIRRFNPDLFREIVNDIDMNIDYKKVLQLIQKKSPHFYEESISHIFIKVNAI